MSPKPAPTARETCGRPCLIRGRTLSFRRAPRAIDDVDSYVYEDDGAVVVDRGIIVASGAFDAVRIAVPNASVIDHRPHLIMPGFIDAHNHMPQLQIIGSYGAQLLDWLQTYTFPAEAAFACADHSARIARAYFQDMLRNGTTTPVAFCSSHACSADAYFREAARLNMRVLGGKVLMDRNAPDSVCDTPQSGFDDTSRLIADWHGRGRALYAISPRFAITSTPEQLEMTRGLKVAHPDCYLQTHLSENREEIAYTLSLYPDCADYLGVYERFDLLGPRTLLGHAIHVSDRERAAMAESGAIAVYCPTSNLFIGSGLFDLSGSERAGVSVAVATDIGGGTSPSMLRTLDEAYKIQQLQNRSVDPLTAFDMITRRNAEALGLHASIGTLEAGSEADLVVLNVRATPALEQRAETVTSLTEELFVLQTLGDDRCVQEVYVSGKPMLAEFVD